MVDRTASAAAEIATLRQKVAAAEARIREIEADKNNGFKPFTWWKSDKNRRLAEGAGPSQNREIVKS
jgi:hypothetical protein